MKRAPLRQIVSPAVQLLIDNIDTDQIIPARFLKGVERNGLDSHLFADWRYDAAGNDLPNFILNKPEARAAKILVAGHNFGCGSSREHAPWALVDFGFQAIISTQIADIFSNNALKNGLLPITVPASFHAQIVQQPSTALEIDLVTQSLCIAGGPSERFDIDAFARYRLLNGLDELDFLLQQDAQITAFEKGAKCAPQ